MQWNLNFSGSSPDSEAVWFTPPQTAAEWKQQIEALRPILDRDRYSATE
jgi:hypothetical protein